MEIPEAPTKFVRVASQYAFGETDEFVTQHASFAVEQQERLNFPTNSAGIPVVSDAGMIMDTGDLIIVMGDSDSVIIDKDPKESRRETLADISEKTGKRAIDKDLD